MTDLHSALAAHVRSAVRRSRVTQSNVALLLGMSPSAFSERMSGTTRWTAVDLQRLADAIGVDVRELLQPVAAA